MTKAIKDRDCCRELLNATMEDYDEMGRAYEAKLATLRAEESSSFSHGGRVYSAEILSH